MDERLNTYLRYLVDNEGSDLYLTVAAPPSVKINGQMMPIDTLAFACGEVDSIAQNIMTDAQRKIFAEHPEMNLALPVTGVGRFRVNIFRQRAETGMVIRHIKSDIPSIESLGLPPLVKQLCLEKNGLILFVGGTNTGKSTSLASLMDYRNTHCSGHIISVEDPIEYLHSHKKSIVNQREVGIDTDSYADALRNTLRQAPDVILIGEINSQETMQHAITFSETGHLCLSTLHANNAHQALERVINFFPIEHRERLLLDLSLNLRAIISQRLVPTVQGRRVAAFEILLTTPLVKDYLLRGAISEIDDVIGRSEDVGMQSFDEALYQLYTTGKISEDNALQYANSRNNLRLRINLGNKNPH